MGPPAAFAALGANGSSDLGFAPLRVRSLSLSNPHGPAVWRRASHTRSLSASAEDVAQRRNRACQLGPSAPNFDLIEVQQGPHQCGSEISAPGSQYSPRCKGRLRVTELAMAVALAVGCTCTYPAATTADGTAPSTATLQKISGGQTLVTPQSDKASLIPKIDPAGWLDEPPSPAPDKGAASAPAVGPAGLDDKSAGKGKTKPAAPAEKVVVDPLALKTKEDPQPPKNSVVSEIPSSLTPNKQSNSACPPGFVKSLVSGGKISITCKPRTIDDARKAMVGNLAAAKREMSRDERAALEGVEALRQKLAAEDASRQAASVAKAKKRAKSQVGPPKAAGEVPLDRKKAEEQAETERKRIVAEAAKAKEVAAKKTAAVEQREQTAAQERRKGEAEVERRAAKKKQEEEARSMELRLQEKRQEESLKQSEDSLRKAQEAEIIKQLETGGDIPLTDTLPSIPPKSKLNAPKP